MSLQELRVRGSYLHHKEVKAAQGIKIAAQNLENAVAGTQMLVVQKGDSIEDLKEEVMGDMTDIFKSVDKSGMALTFQFLSSFLSRCIPLGSEGWLQCDEACSLVCVGT